MSQFGAKKTTGRGTGGALDAAGRSYIDRTDKDGNILEARLAFTITPRSTEVAGVNVIPPGVTKVRLGANVTDVNDFTVLPALSSVPSGHEITIISGAAASEVRTPAGSNEKINNVDSDGTAEYLLGANTIHRFTKIDNTIGWMGQGYTALGAVVTAVIPD